MTFSKMKYLYEKELIDEHINKTRNKEDFIKNKGYIPGYYAVFVDFHRRKIGLNDYYGNEMFKRNEDDSFSYFQIDDISTVDSRRAEIGLAPLYFHANHWNMKLPEGYSFDLEKFLADLRREIKN